MSAPGFLDGIYITLEPCDDRLEERWNFEAQLSLDNTGLCLCDDHLDLCVPQRFYRFTP